MKQRLNGEHVPQILWHFVPVDSVPPIWEIPTRLRARATLECELALARSIHPRAIVASTGAFHHHGHAVLPHNMPKGSSAILQREQSVNSGGCDVDAYRDRVQPIIIRQQLQ